MPEYEIKSWNAIIPKEANYPLPSVYIKPDKNFADYAKENNYTVLITVKDTNSKYDTASVLAVIDSSGYYPDYRPNFYNKTGYFILTLLSEWIGYPPKNGKITIRGNEGEDKITVESKKPFVVPQAIELYEPKKDSLKYSQIIIVLSVIFLVFCGLLLFNLHRNQ